MDNTNRPTPREIHEKVSKDIRGYAAFVAALLIATIAGSKEHPHGWIVISLFALSLPSLLAYEILDYHVRVVQGRDGSTLRGLAALMGFAPSIAGLATLVGHFSLIAGILLPILVLCWFLAVRALQAVGSQNPNSRI